MKQLNEKQLQQVTAILKLYANTSGIFEDENGFPVGAKVVVKLPCTELTITRKEIMEIRSVLKEQLYKKQKEQVNSVRQLMTYELNK